MRIRLFCFIFLHCGSKHLGADNDLYSAFKNHGDTHGGARARGGGGYAADDLGSAAHRAGDSAQGAHQGTKLRQVC